MNLEKQLEKLERIKIFSMSRKKNKKNKGAFSGPIPLPLINKDISLPAFGFPTGGMAVLSNPTEISEKHGWKLEKTGPIGSDKTNIKFVRKKPQSLTLPILLDATGVMEATLLPIEIPFNIPQKAEETLSIKMQVEYFLMVTGKYSGKEHGPKPCLIVWGPHHFYGYLETLDIKYTLHTPGGKPLRAKLTATFQESVSEDIAKAIEDNQSPDLSHLRTVKEGDTLPLLCLDVYGDESRYLEVARHNGLVSFRNLRPGMQLNFPPIEQ